MRKIITIIYSLFCTYTGYCQCNIQSNNRPDGTVVRYLRPEMVGANERLEVGLSIQTNGSNYYLATMTRFLSNAYAPGDLTISNDLNQTCILKLLRAEKTYLNGSDVYLAVYELSKRDVKRLTSSNLNYLMFETSDNTLNALKVSKNKDVIAVQYRCLTLTNGQVVNSKQLHSSEKSTDTIVSSQYMTPEEALKYAVSHKDKTALSKDNPPALGSLSLSKSIDYALHTDPNKSTLPKSRSNIDTGKLSDYSSTVVISTDGSSKYDAGYIPGNGESLKEYRERNREVAFQNAFTIIEKVLFVIISIIGMVFLIRFALRNRSVIRKFFMG